MKKILISALALFLISSNCYAIDTKLGRLSLTEKQISQTEALKNENIKGFSFWQNGDVEVVTESALSAEERATLSASLIALPDEFTKQYLESHFNRTQFESDIYQAIGSSMIKLSSYYAILIAMIDHKNFDGIKHLEEELEIAGALNQQELTALNGCFLSQGIDLNNYGG